MKIRKILLVLCAVIFTVASIYVIFQQVEQQRNRRASELLAEESRINAAIQQGDISEITEEVSEDYEEEARNFVEIPIDFASLQERNPDVHAWIRIPGTDINYPVLQSQDYQEYYLNHDIDHNPNPAGAIFTQDFNSLDFTDVHTLIYGHNMSDGSKFSILYRYLDARFMEEHGIIYIYTPYNVFRYEVVYAITYDDRHILMSFDFDDDEQYLMFFRSLQNAPNVNALWNPNTSIRVGERLITLSTCNDNPYQRFLIGAVLIETFYSIEAN